jgi:hypothetical protein
MWSALIIRRKAGAGPPNLIENIAVPLRLLYVAAHNNWDEAGGTDWLAIPHRRPTSISLATHGVEEVRYR